jgi:hypothetical protein
MSATECQKAYWKAQNDKRKAYRDAYYVERKHEYQQYYQERKDAYAARCRQWRSAHNIEYVAYHDIWRQAHREYYRIRTRTWQKANPGKVNAAVARRAATVLKATPPWLTTQHFVVIERFYVEAARLQAIDGIKRHVDHIYPLQGKAVCGLHVPWNLQILVATDNLVKHNKMPAFKK